MVGDPGIEPGVSRLEGVTVPCHTLRPVAHTCAFFRHVGSDNDATVSGQARNPIAVNGLAFGACKARRNGMGKKPEWVIKKEQAKAATVWLFGLHAVRDALANPNRKKVKLVLTKNAADRLGDAVSASGIQPQIADPRKFPVPLDPGSVHQGAALEVKPLDWGPLSNIIPEEGPSTVLLLDRVTDPHNVGAILRSAEVFGASAVVAPARHSAPETGALAKSASGALERQPYLRVKNLSTTMDELKKLGFHLIGLDGTAETQLEQAIHRPTPRLALILGAEGPGMREKTKENCDELARIRFAGECGSLTVSNAAAVALYASHGRET